MPRSMRRIVLSQREEGFTLVELVVAMLIIGIVLVSVATVQVGTLQTNANNAARNTASALANGAMEQFRSIPWNVLRKGMASNYLLASGGDDSVFAGVLRDPSDSTLTHNIVVALSGPADQNLTHSWLPLYDPSGSHIQVVDDPEGNGNVYRVKAYVTNSDSGAEGAVGLAVIVEWQRPGSDVVHYTSMYSSAYAPTGGCGNLNTAPFLTSCQPQYASSASSGSATVLVSANEYDAASGEAGGALPVVPGTTWSGINAAGSRARAESDSTQNTVVSATVEHAVSSVSPLSETDPARIVGGTPSLVLQASDNTVDPLAPPPHAGVNSGTGDTSLTDVTGSGEWVTVDGDEGRNGAVTASTTSACNIGAYSLPAHQPCAAARVDANWSSPLKATWLFEGEHMDLVTANAPPTNASWAWVARFHLGQASGSPLYTGCSALSGAGCVSAGATSYGPPIIQVGKMVSSGWDGGEAPDGLVNVQDYADSVLVQRGAAQSATDPTISRTATISYWSGTGYITLPPVVTSTVGTWSTGHVSYSGANVTVTGSATISVSGPITRESGSNCAVDRCRAQADAGLISVTLTLVVEPTSGTSYMLETVLLINGSTALAQYTEPVDV